jgi:hypothetical protein
MAPITTTNGGGCGVPLNLSNLIEGLVPFGQVQYWHIVVANGNANPQNPCDPPYSVTFKELWCDRPDSWICSVTIPCRAYTISPVALCAGGFTTLTITPPPPPGADISWYSSPTGPGNDCPDWPEEGWTPGGDWELEGGPNYGPYLNTGKLTESRCYHAEITTGCCHYSAEGTVTVCSPYYGSITASDDPGSPSLAVIDGENHACRWYSGLLTLSPAPDCPSTITWTRQLNGGTVENLPDCGQQPCCQQTTGHLKAPVSPDCVNRYVFTATVSNVCGNTPVSFVVNIDSIIGPGEITADPLYIGDGTIHGPILCNPGFTILTYKGECGKIVEWDSSMEISSGYWTAWKKIDRAGIGPIWWTAPPLLTKTTKYRVIVDYGACGQVPSPEIIVTIKPALSVTIGPNPCDVCILPGIITAYPSIPSVTYHWKKDGDFIPEFAKTLDPSPYGAGWYRVVVSDGACGSVQSNVVWVCGRPVVAIAGPCGICQPGHIHLKAVVAGGCGPYTYRWKRDGVVVGTTKNLTATAPGTYTVTVKHGNCVVTSPDHIVRLCPKF